MTDGYNSTADPDILYHGPVADLLAAYLLSSPTIAWPGSDGLALADVLKSYPALASAGHVPLEAVLCARHPELAARLVAFFYRTGAETPPH